MRTILDPNKTGTQVPVVILGLIPSMMYEAESAMLEDSSVSFMELLSQEYGFPLMIMGGTVDKGVYNYPSDKPLDPLALYDMGAVQAYQYHYGIIAIIVDGKTTIVRMD